MKSSQLEFDFGSNPTTPQSDNYYDLAEVAAILNIKGFGAINLSRFLKYNSVLNGFNRPLDPYLANGYCDFEIQQIISPYGKFLKTSCKPYFSDQCVNHIKSIL